MSSSNAETTRLVLTAIGASLAGAAIALGVMSAWTRHDEDYHYHHRRRRSNSFIFEDPSEAAVADAVLFPHNHEEKMRRQVAARAAVDEENSLPRQSVTVRVPATSANMGPGCECGCGCCCCCGCDFCVVCGMHLLCTGHHCIFVSYAFLLP